jgi:hypothetical protein
MTLIELLKEPILQLPLKREGDFSIFLKEIFSEYILLIERYNGELSDQLQQRLGEIKELISLLNNSISSYYIGNVSEAYKAFDKAVSLVQDFLIQKPIKPNGGIGQVIVSYSHLEQHYFKARTTMDFSLKREQMFIRPFEQREMIPTYRYSIPGLPCLYLSNNVLTAWYELGCPDINTMQVSRFEISAALKKFNFAWNSNFFATSLPLSPTFNMDLITNYLTYFPLHAACTVSVQNRQSHFKPEYIFPQFLMQWIRENNIEAIEYMSTQIDYRRLNNDLYKMAFKNIAIPSQTSSALGSCFILRNKIELTNPISWQNLLVSYPNLNFPSENKKETNLFALLNSALSLELIEGKPVMYGMTAFGKIEEYLYKHMKVEHID